jgi:LysM repeat protein
MTGDCNSFHRIVAADTCDAIAGKYRITTTELYSWNKAIDTSCRNLQADYYVCVNVIGRLPSPPSSSTNNGIATTTPIQQDMITYCTRFHEVVPGDYCALVAQKYSITSSQIIKWNPDVGTECRSLLVGYQVCVGTL